MSEDGFSKWKTKACDCHHEDREKSTGRDSLALYESYNGCYKVADKYGKLFPKANKEQGRRGSGRHRSESAPDTLLDCLHCGKDLVDSQIDSLQKKRGHVRRSTVASETAWSEVTTRSPDDSALTSRLKEKDWGNVSLYKQDCACGLQRTNPVCGTDRCHENFPFKYYVQNTTNQKCLSSDSAGQVRGSGLRNTSSADYFTPEEKGDPVDLPVERRSRICSAKTCPYRQTAPNSFDNEFIGRGDFSRNAIRHAGYTRKAQKLREDHEDDAKNHDEDSEAGLVNVNENRRRNSLTCFLHSSHIKDSRKVLAEKPKRRSYPICRTTDKNFAAVGDAEPLDSFKGQGRRLSTRPIPRQRHRYRKDGESAARPLSAKHDHPTTQPLSTTDEEDENGEDSDSIVHAHLSQPCRGESLLVANLSDMWRRHRLCDVILRSNGQDVAAHRLALAAFSEGFARRYCEGDAGQSRREEKVVIQIPETSAGGIQEVLRFVYTGELRLTTDNVANVLAAAAYLGITSVVDVCKKMVLSPDVETVVSFSLLAEKYHLTDDLAFYYDFICQHFMPVSRTRAWRALSFGQVFDLLSEDNLHVERELDVFHAAVAWIDGNRAKRLTFAADLIGCVRFVYITPDEIAKHVETKDFLFLGDEGKELLLCIYRHHALQTCGCHRGRRGLRLPRRQYVGRTAECRPSPQDQCNSANGQPCQSSQLEPQVATNRSLRSAEPSPPRIPGPVSDVILAAGGVNPLRPEAEAQARRVEQFHPRHNSWTELTSLPDGRHHHGLAWLKNGIYVIGGSVLDDLNPGHLCNPTATCYRYDLASRQWSATAPLNTPRMYHSIAVLNDVVFVLAGQTQQSRHLSSMECYRPEVGEWETGTDLSEGRIGIAVAAYRGQLYAVGGFLETDNQHVVRATVETFDPAVGRWVSLNNLPTPRCHAGLAECAGKLYLVGGSTFPAHTPAVCSLSSVLRYDEVDDRWYKVQTLRTPRHDMGIAVLGCCIFIVGGVSSTESRVLSDVECYDVDTDCWLDDVEPIKNPALGLACLAVPLDN